MFLPATTHSVHAHLRFAAIVATPHCARLDSDGEGVRSEVIEGKVDRGQQGNLMVEVDLVRDKAICVALAPSLYFYFLFVLLLL